MGDASQYEKQRERLIATKQYESYVKAAAERKRKSRSEKECMLLEKGGVELLQECKREEFKQFRIDRVSLSMLI